MSGDTNLYKELIVNNAERIRAINGMNGAMVNSKQCFKLHTT